jgi:hypothetical protein
MGKADLIGGDTDGAEWGDTRAGREDDGLGGYEELVYSVDLGVVHYLARRGARLDLHRGKDHARCKMKRGDKILFYFLHYL